MISRAHLNHGAAVNVERDYLQVAGKSVHVPPTHAANASHCALAEAGSQGWPSAMMVGHVPVGSFPVAFWSIGHRPCEQNRSSPSHVPPGATKETGWHVRSASHANPTPQSPPVHAAPAPRGTLHVRALPPLQMSPDAQSVDSTHAPPPATGAAQDPLVDPLAIAQWFGALQPSFVEHAAPTSPSGGVF